MQDLRVLGNHAHHLVTLGTAQAGGRGDGLVVGSVNQHAAALLQVADLGLVGVEHVDHQQAHRTKSQDSQRAVNDQHSHYDRVHFAEKQQCKQHEQPLADGSDAQQQGILEGEMPDDDDVGLQQGEHQGGTDQGGEAPDAIEGAVGNQPHTQQESEDRDRDRYDYRNDQIHQEDLSPAQESGAEFIQILAQSQHTVLMIILVTA